MKKTNYFSKATRFQCRKVKDFEQVEIIGTGEASGQKWVRWIRNGRPTKWHMYADPDAIQECDKGLNWMTGPEFLQAADAQVAHNNRFATEGAIQKSMQTHPPEPPKNLKPIKKDPARPRIPDAQETRERHRQPEAEAEKWDPSFLKSYAQLEAERRALA